MGSDRYKAADLMELGIGILTRPPFGFTEKQAKATARILLEADLRGDPDHGMVTGDKLNEIYIKVNDDVHRQGFKRISNPAYLKQTGAPQDFTVDIGKYPTVLSVDAHGLLGHYVALELLPRVIETAGQFGYAKAYIRNSTHFGNCGIYSEIIADADLAAKVSCTSPAYLKPFIELQGDPSKDEKRYEGVRKRFGTNPFAWSIPYDAGIITIDMATTQRAVSPAVNTAHHNARLLGIPTVTTDTTTIGHKNRKIPLRDVHLKLAQIDKESDLQSELSNLGYDTIIPLRAVEEGLLKGPAGEDIHFPLAFDNVFKRQFWVAPLGGTFFGYKGFGLNMLVELDNVMGGGEPDFIRRLDADGKPKTPEYVSQTIEAYAIDMVYPLAEVKKRIGESVRTTRRCGNRLMFLPGEKEQQLRKKHLAKGIPLTPEQLKPLQRVAEKVGASFNLEPME